MLQSFLLLCFNTFKTYLQPNKLNLISIIINFILLILLGLVIYIGLAPKSYYDLVLSFITLIIFFPYYYIVNSFKFSNNFVIRLLQYLLLNIYIILLT